MSTANDTLYGQDVLLDDNLDAALSASGEMILATGVQSVMQDINVRIETPTGGLFYDADFGSDLYLALNDEQTAAVRQAMVLELEDVIEQDPRVVMGSVKASVASYDERSVTISTEFQLISNQNTYNLVVEVGGGMVRVLEDVD